MLKGRRGLVTGGGRGIGRAVVLALARDGVDTAVVARTRVEIEAVTAEALALGVRATALTADVSRSADVGAVFRDAAAAFGGGIDILVNGAGIAPTAPVVKTTDEMWQTVLAVNLSGVFYATREALPGMVERGFGRIVNIASIAAKSGMPYVGAYAASKHGVLGLTRVAALEVATRGVTVNAVCPGYVDTPMTDAGIAAIVAKTGRRPEDIRRQLEEMSPQKRMVTPEEVAALVLFLCGEEARGITGQALNVDGGTLP